MKEWVALTAQRVFVLPAGRRIKIDGTAGMQVAMAGKEFGPPPAYAGLDAQDQRRTLTFRIEGDPLDDVQISLERRTLQADVDFAPKKAEWPRDNVAITVQLRDPNRRIDPSTVYPRLRAKVNDTPVQATLVKQSQSWRAVIPSRNGYGPWTLRVEVLDQDDSVLGQGVLQILGKPRE